MRDECVGEHEIVTGDVPPMRAAPYQLPEK